MKKEFSKRKGLTLSKKSVEHDKHEFYHFNIEVSDSGLLKIYIMIKNIKGQEIQSYKPPIDDSYYEDYEILVKDIEGDTISHKVINRIIHQDDLNKILNVVELDEKEKLKEQKNKILKLFRTKFNAPDYIEKKTR